ncbi:MAG: hypothetical protein WCQ89_22295 [Verrucomicrobiota bacterium]|jgi:hypothetical protein
MHRLPLLLCLVALAGSAVSGVLFFQIGNTKQVLEQRLSDASTRLAKTDADLAAANEHAGALKARASALDTELTGTKRQLDTVRQQAATAQGRALQLERDLGQAKDVLAVYELTARALADDVGALRQELEDTRNSNTSPEAVAAYKKTITDLERQLATARDGATVGGGVGGSTAVFASRAGRATVLSVGPQNAFVVLNFGSARGAQTGQKMTVAQASGVVATVQLSDVRDKFSIAQVLPETLRGVLQKGDSAVLIR